MNELVITGYRGNGISALYENGKMKQVSAFQPQQFSEIGNIYVGRIDNIVKILMLRLSIFQSVVPAIWIWTQLRTLCFPNASQRKKSVWGIL